MDTIKNLDLKLLSNDEILNINGGDIDMEDVGYFVGFTVGVIFGATVKAVDRLFGNWDA